MKTILTIILFLLFINVAAVAEPDHKRKQELVYLIRQDCGSCHGLLLKGGLGPALLPENLKNLPEQILVAVILYGRPEKAMPAWQDILSEDEALWVVRQLKKGLKDERS